MSEEAQSIKKKFDELFRKTNKRDAKEADVDALRAMLNKHESERLWDTKVGPMGAALSFTLQTLPFGQGFAECWRKRMPEMRDDLGYKDASELEKLLIQHITLCWLRLAMAEAHSSLAYENDVSLAVATFHEKKLTACQKRFTRACESLVKVRRLMQGVRPFERQAETEAKVA